MMKPLLSQGETSPPPVTLVCFLKEKENELGIAQLKAGRWTTKPLFRMFNEYSRDARVSPDRQWLYILTEAAWFGRLKEGSRLQQLGGGKLGNYYVCLFFPNSRYLLGDEIGGEGSYHRLAVFELPQGEGKILSEGEGDIFYSFGWYPDNRHVWYELKLKRSGKEQRGFYRQDVVSGKRSVLKGEEVRRLKTDWVLLDQRFRYTEPHRGQPSYAYSRDQKVRLYIVGSQVVYWQDGVRAKERVRPYGFCQWRDGRKRLVLTPKQHPWWWITGLDVTNDGKWGLLFGITKIEERKFESEVVLVDILRRKTTKVLDLNTRLAVGGKRFGLLSSRLDHPVELCYFG